MSQMIPMTRAQLQQEGVDGNKRAQIQGLIQRVHHQILGAARAGQTEYFFLQPMSVGMVIRNGSVSHLSQSLFITHEDVILELSKLFPGVTMTSIEQKGTKQMVYQQAGILLDWS
jgi:hypothetical protein